MTISHAQIQQRPASLTHTYTSVHAVPTCSRTLASYRRLLLRPLRRMMMRLTVV